MNLNQLNRAQKLEYQKKLETSLEMVKNHLDDVVILSEQNKYQISGLQLALINTIIEKYNGGYKTLPVMFIEILFETPLVTEGLKLLEKKGLINFINDNNELCVFLTERLKIEV